MNRFGLSRDYPMMKIVPLIKVDLDETGEIAKYAYGPGLRIAGQRRREDELRVRQSERAEMVRRVCEDDVELRSGLSLGNVRLQHGLQSAAKRSSSTSTTKPR